MKAWRTLLGLGFCSLLAVGCTVTTGDGVDDDDAPADDTGKDDAPADDTAKDDAPADDTSKDAAVEDDTQPDVDAGEQQPEPDAAPKPPPTEKFECDPKAKDACEACMATSCCDERAACGDNAVCAKEWSVIKACMDKKDLGNNVSEEPAADLQEC
ncbi:MAG: hypothetical protein RJA70_4771, partial [Pseudomonadota bacterium]